MTARPRRQRGTDRDGLPGKGGKNQRAKSSRAKRRHFLWAGSLVFIAAIVAYGLFATDLLGGSRAAGEPPPEVTLNTVDGEFRLSQERGKVLLLYFSFPG